MTDKQLTTHDVVEGKPLPGPVVADANQRGAPHRPRAHAERAPSKPLGLAVSPAKLQEALLFRWKSAFTVGLLLAGIGAGIAWFTYKPRYTALTTMRMSLNKQRLLPALQLDDGSRSVEEFQKTEAQMVRSREVLRTALQKEQIRGLSTIRNLEDPLVWLEKEVQAYFVVGTDIFRIALSGEDPVELALIVNTVRDAYVHQHQNLAKKQQAERYDNIVNVMVESEEKIRKQRELLRELAHGLKTGDTQVLTLKQRLALEEFFDRKRELSTLDADIRRMDALKTVQESALNAVAVATAEPSKLPASVVEEYIDRHPKVQKQQMELLRLESQIKEYRTLVTSTNPRLAQLEEEIKTSRANLQKVKTEVLPTLSKSIQDVMRRQKTADLDHTLERLRVAKEQRTTLAEVVVQLSKEAEKVGLGSFEIEVRRTEIEQAESVLKTLRGEKERLEIEKFNSKETIVGKQDADVPTVNQASLPKTALMYAIAGLALGLLSVSYLEARVHRVHTPAQVEQELGIATLGILPLLGAKDIGPHGEALLGNNTVSDIMFTDAVNGVCARLLCDDRLHESAVIMVTSANEAEGKTMLATQLAVALASTGHRTLLLDCDFRNSSCHQRFGVAATPGLSEVLRGEADLTSALQAIPDSDARILTAGQSNPQIIRTLSNGIFAGLLTRLRKDFNHIVIDAAPTPIVADGLLIGKLVTGVMLVVRPKVSKAAEVIAAYDQLAALHIPILGAVVNGNQTRTTGRNYK